MQSIRKLLLASAAASLMATFALPAAAAPVPASNQVAQAGACRVSLTGPITQVLGPNEFAIRADNRRVGNIHIYDSNARINAHGVPLAAGSYAGVYGCFSSDMRSFTAEQVTLAPSQSAYAGELASPNSEVAAAPGYQVGPCHVSLFGTVTQVFPNGYEFTLQTTGRIGSIHVYDKGARMNANGLSMRNGIFTGVYGCFINNQRFFHANEVTLATSAQTYNSSFHPAIVVSGLVDEIGRGWIGVQTRWYGHVHVITNQTNIRSGQRVTIQGTYNTVTRQIDATSVAVI